MIEARNIREELRALSRRRPNTTYYASDDTGWAIFALFDFSPEIAPWDAFVQWTQGKSLRIYGINVRSRRFIEQDRASYLRRFKQ